MALVITSSLASLGIMARFRPKADVVHGEIDYVCSRARSYSFGMHTYREYDHD